MWLQTGYHIVDLSLHQLVYDIRCLFCFVSSYIGDCQLTVACEAFVKDYGSEIYQKNLGRNFILHLVNLCDFSLIRPEIVYRIAIQFFRLRRQLEDSAKGEPVASSSS